MSQATKEELLKKIAYLEFEHDQLLTELSDIDDLLRNVGFPEGLQSAKAVAQEVIEDQQGEE